MRKLNKINMLCSTYSKFFYIGLLITACIYHLLPDAILVPANLQSGKMHFKVHILCDFNCTRIFKLTIFVEFSSS